jgi:hypothetical protein
MFGRCLVAIVAVGLLATALAPVAAAAPAPKVAVCHASAANGGWTLISISGNALPAHLAIGDGQPGGAVPGKTGYRFSATCVPVKTERDFAVAWTDGNGNHTYEPGTDVLIAKLVDANNDGVPDAGDTIVTDKDRLDLTGIAFGTFGLTTHSIVFAFAATGVIEVGDASANYSTWITPAYDPGVEAYLESGGANATLLMDSFVPDGDAILANPGSPSLPASAVDLEASDEGSNTFLDVSIP